MQPSGTDPGYGIKLGKNTRRVVDKNGNTIVRRFGERFHPTDVYHYLVTISWTKFFILTVTGYVVLNFLFAAAFLLIGADHINNADPLAPMDPFERSVFFSAQTLTTVGYGQLTPRGMWMSTAASLEALFGLILFGTVTGLSFSRFARIKPRLLFSREAVVAPHRDGCNALMVRTVNERQSVVMDADATMILVLQEMSADQPYRRYHTLPLDVTHISTLALNWTLVHTIDTDSPLYGMDAASLRRQRAELIVVLSAFDDTVGQQFYSRTSYQASDVVFGRRFAPMFWTNGDGDLELHLECTHDTADAPLFPSPAVVAPPSVAP